MKQWFKEIIITEEEIKNKCKELADWVNLEYKSSENLIIVGLLKGCLPFLAELIKNIKVLHKLDFMTVSSFNGNMHSGNLKVVMDLKADIYQKEVLIVEDIIDSGCTLLKVTENLKLRKPKSIRTMVLLDKKLGRKLAFKVDKYGFVVPNKFLVGFGLDIKEKLRNVPYIGVFDENKLGEL